MAIRLWMNVFLFWIYCSSAWSADPYIKIIGFEPQCPKDGIDTVTMKAEVDMTSVNTYVWSVRVVLVFVPTYNEIAVAFLDKCAADKGGLKCEKYGSGDKYNVTFERVADAGYSRQNFMLRMEDINGNGKTSPTNPYPTVIDPISETLELDGTNLTLGGTCIRIDKDARITYRVSGLVLPYNISILGASKNAIVASTTQPEVFTVISNTIETIYVQYEMQGKCSMTKTTEVCFVSCCGQNKLILTLGEFKPHCIKTNGEQVTVKGIVDMSSANATWEPISVDIMYDSTSVQDQQINTAPLSTCGPRSGLFYCNETDNSKYTVIYNASSNAIYSSTSFRLMMSDKMDNKKSYSDPVTYPVFEDTISENLEVNRKAETIGGDCIELSSDNNITVKYSVSGLVLAYTVSILDSSNNVLADSTTQPDISTTISSTTKELYVKYEMTGSCSKTAKICFVKSTQISCNCGEKDVNEDKNKPSDCVQGDYNCRQATSRGYINGKIVCCLDNKQLSYTSSCAANGEHQSSCRCAYNLPPGSNTC